MGEKTARISKRWLAHCAVLGLAAMAPASGLGAAPRQSTCRKIVLMGEVSAGEEWKAGIGQGWILRVVPIDATKTPAGLDPYSGWDLVVDRVQPAGFPDALFLATPPYNSINEREIGTTFGVRAQDAIGWNPRSFRFLTDLAAFRESRQLHLQLIRDSGAGQAQAGKVHQRTPGAGAFDPIRRLMALTRQSSPGQFRILDARMTPGVADAAPFAENWALQPARTAHTAQPAPGGKSTPLGFLLWIRFSITLWLPDTWNAPAALHAERGACSE